VPDDVSNDVQTLVDWDPRVVTQAAQGLIAADATSRIVAVSDRAARILGYDDPAELVGRRIVSIVPPRYRQAHVAGFTMYLLVGRKPLLDQEVRVPALRRDGTEVDVRLNVRSPSAASGRSVLLADIELADPAQR
jgi:PAS domain S-box-containing protein